MKKILIAIFAVLLLSSPVWACSMCYKDPNSPMTIGVQQAVFVLLGALFLVFAAVIKFIWSFRKRSQALGVK